VRQLAAVLLSIGLLLAAAAALVPVSVSVPAWADGSCGPPAVRYFADASVDDDNEQALVDRCEDAARSRLVVAATMVVAGVLAGLLALMAAWRHEAVVRRRKAARRRQRAEQEEATRMGIAPQISS
jgi:hypothetical protein